MQALLYFALPALIAGFLLAGYYMLRTLNDKLNDEIVSSNMKKSFDVEVPPTVLDDKIARQIIELCLHFEKELANQKNEINKLKFLLNHTTMTNRSYERLLEDVLRERNSNRYPGINYNLEQPIRYANAAPDFDYDLSIPVAPVRSN